MRHLIVVVSLGLAGLAAGTGYGFGHEVLAEMPMLPTFTYDCKRHVATDSFLSCVCLEGQEARTCTFPIPKNRYDARGKR